MSARYYILLPGIRTDPKDWGNWSVRMASDINMLTEAKAEEFRYMALAVTPKGRQLERAEYVARLAERVWRRGYRPVLVGHSNGCEVIRQALPMAACIIEAAHLIAGAAEADWLRGGWAAAMWEGKVGEVFCYTGSRDWVLRYVAAAGGWLGYGRLGYTGPENVPAELRHRVVVTPSDHDHCGWFEGDAYARTLRLVCRKEEM